MSADSRDIFTLIRDWEQGGYDFALAIVVSTWGSSPRQAGSLMAIRKDGLIEGSVSGGCVEGSVIHSANELMDKGGAADLEFGVADEMAWQVGLSCGGKIRVWVFPHTSMDENLIRLASEAINQRRHLYIDCHITDQKMQLSTAEQVNMLNADADCFHLAVLPQPRLFIIGAVHISQHLAPMANAVGFDVTVIDPRETFAHQARFPDITIRADWPEDALKDIVIDRDTACVTLTHDPKIDDDALKLILAAQPFYVACLGSRKTHAARRERLLQYGFEDNIIDQIHGPAGLDIGATTPAEIAVSVLAELVAAYRKMAR